MFTINLRMFHRKRRRKKTGRSKRANSKNSTSALISDDVSFYLFKQWHSWSHSWSHNSRHSSLQQNETVYWWSSLNNDIKTWRVQPEDRERYAERSYVCGIGLPSVNRLTDPVRLTVQDRLTETQVREVLVDTNVIRVAPALTETMLTVLSPRWMNDIVLVEFLPMMN